MSERLWDRADEWTDHALCIDKPDFITAPEELGRLRRAVVKSTCARCPVRPECIEMNAAPVANIDLKRNSDGEIITRPSSAVWIAGRWLPEAGGVAATRELEAVRESLLASVPRERLARPEGIL